MYRTYYSLSTRPFSEEIKTHNLFESDNFKETISRLNYLKTTRGIGVIVGESGCGKTSALRAFADNLNSSLFKVIYSPPFYRFGYGFLQKHSYRLRGKTCFSQVCFI